MVPTGGGFPFGEGEVYQKLQQYEKAVERYTEAIRRNDKALAISYYPVSAPRETADAHLGRGFASYRLGLYREAIEDYNAVLEVMPRSSRTIAWRGAAYQYLGKRAEAIADYQAALEIDPKNETALKNLKSLGEQLP